MGGGVKATVDLVGAVELQRRFGRAAATIGPQLVDEVNRSARPLVHDMQASTASPVERRAARSVQIRKERDGVEVSGGRGGGLGAVLFVGGEFGGRSGRKRLVRGSVYGGPVTWVRKRATMMFKPHLGAEGYFFWPTIRTWLPKVHDRVEERARGVLGGR